MSDTSDEDCTTGEGSDDAPWVLYKDRDEWKDVTPVAQDDGPNPIVSIAYSEKFKDAYDYFRAILMSGEKSERALSLVEDCIWLNPANYTAWQYRREILKALDKDLQEELGFVDKMIKYSSKNYQVWHHRKVIIEWSQDASQELQFTSSILVKDAKNYHAWQHRQWCIKTFNLYEKELEYVEQLLHYDVRNNSAWNQRFFVIQNTTKFTPEVIDSELDFVFEKIELVKGNESAWNYLRGILAMDSRGGLETNKKVQEMCQTLYKNGCRSNHLLACIIDITHDSWKSSKEHQDSFYNIDNALKLCKELAEEYDKIRHNYWNYISHTLKALKSN